MLTNIFYNYRRCMGRRFGLYGIARRTGKSYFTLIRQFLMTCAHEFIFLLLFFSISYFRVHVFEKEQKTKRLMEMRTNRMRMIRSKRSWALSVL